MPTYRRQCRWYVNSTMLIDIWGIVETANRENVQGEFTLLGRPIVVCDSLALAGAGNLAAILAVPKYLLQRRVRDNGMYLERHQETAGFAESGEVLIKSTVRADFMPVNYASAVPPYVALYLHN